MYQLLTSYQTVSPIFISSRKVLHQNYIIRQRILHLWKGTICWGDTKISLCSSVSIVNFEQVNSIYNCLNKCYRWNLKTIELRADIQFTNDNDLRNSRIDFRAMFLARRKFSRFQNPSTKINSISRLSFTHNKSVLLASQKKRFHWANAATKTHKRQYQPPRIIKSNTWKRTIHFWSHTIRISQCREDHCETRTWVKKQRKVQKELRYEHQS